jgi:hypothetical protein
MPMAFRLAFGVGVVALAGAVLFAGQGGLATLASGVSSAFSGFVDDVTSTPSPSPSPVIELSVPTLDPPTEPYTNQPTVDITGTIPLQFLGQEGLVVRLYVTPKDGEREPVTEQAVSDTASFTFAAVELVDGSQVFDATLGSTGGDESERSAEITYVLDTAKPKVTITAPKKNAVVNGAAATIKGKTQGRSTIIARNARNGASANATAEPDGAFQLSIPLGAGSNKITITVTDPAGNENSAEITLRKGSGKLSAALRANDYEFSRKTLPDPLTVTVTVTDPDGRAVKGATVTFTIAIPGLEPIVSNGKTNSEGKASFKTTIPKGAATGTGSLAALVDAGELGTVTARNAIRIVK